MVHPQILSVLILPFLLNPSHALDLYATDFEAFTVGDNHWAGTDGWISNDVTSGAQGIVQDYINPDELPLGRTAYLGFEPPASSLTIVARPISHDPAAAGLSVIEFDSFLGVQDSTNGRRDQFLVSFYDIGGEFLAAIVFNNASANADVLRWQGKADGSVQTTNTGIPFVRGDAILGSISLQVLFVRIDLAENTWSAQLDGLPLFNNAPFTDPAHTPLTLGSIAAEWELGIPTPSEAGNNWLFVADWFVRASPGGQASIQIESISQSAAGETNIVWRGEPGFNDQVVYSDALQTWHRDLPNSSFLGITQNTLISFTDTDTNRPMRFYRIERSPAR